MRNPEEEAQVDAALDNAYDSNYDQPELDLIYPDLERSKELIQAMVDNPELPKYLGSQATIGEL